MSVININKSNFSQVKDSDKTVFLDCFADW